MNKVNLECTTFNDSLFYARRLSFNNVKSFCSPSHYHINNAMSPLQQLLQGDNNRMGKLAGKS